MRSPTGTLLSSNFSPAVEEGEDVAVINAVTYLNDCIHECVKDGEHEKDDTLHTFIIGC